MRIHVQTQPKLVLPPTTMVVKTKEATLKHNAGEVVAEITRDGRNAVLAVARAHYSGPDFVWEWA